MRIGTIKDVSEFLKVKPSTLYSWVNQKAIPAFKLHGLWRFDMDRIEEWVKDSYRVKVAPQRVLRKKIKNQDIERIVTLAIKEVKDTRES